MEGAEKQTSTELRVSVDFQHFLQRLAQDVNEPALVMTAETPNEKQRLMPSSALAVDNTIHDDKVFLSHF